jgi:hypothetical protein
MDDMVMKMQGAGSGFVDGQYAKFYALYNELLCVGPKYSSPLQDLIPSILPKQLRGEKEQPAFSRESLIVPAPRAADRE